MKWLNTVTQTPLTVKALNAFLNAMEDGLEGFYRQAAQDEGVNIDAFEGPTLSKLKAGGGEDLRGAKGDIARKRIEQISHATGLYRDILFEYLGIPFIEEYDDRMTDQKWYLRQADFPETVKELSQMMADIKEEWKYFKEGSNDKTLYGILHLDEEIDEIVYNALEAMQQALNVGKGQGA